MRGTLLAVSLMAAVAVTHLVDYGVFGLRYQVIDASTHASLFGVLSLLALAVAAGTAFVVGARRLGAVLVVLLVLRLAPVPHVLVVALPFTVVALALMWRWSRPACVLLVVSFAVHGPGELVVRHLGIGYDTWIYQLKVVVKHACELGGWTLLALALASAVRRPASRTIPFTSSDPVSLTGSEHVKREPLDRRRTVPIPGQTAP